VKFLTKIRLSETWLRANHTVGVDSCPPLRKPIRDAVFGIVITFFLTILSGWGSTSAQSLVNYTIVKDDTLWSIASRYSADVGEIKRINNLTSDALFIGQTIQVPYSGSSSTPVTMQRLGVVQHTVAQGDTFANIAARYNVSEETLRRSNPGFEGVLSDAPLIAGLVLAIAPAEGTVVTVQPGQNMLAIALQNGMTVSELSKLNGIKSVQVGQYIFIPGSARPVQVQTSGTLQASAVALPSQDTTQNETAKKSSRAVHLETQKALLERASTLLASYTPPKPSDSFVWPLSGRLTSYYGRRNISVGGNTFHAGLDIAAKTGTPITASRPGTVTKASWGGSYGYVVFLDHGDGSQSRYAHQSQLNVRVGQYVNQGDIVGFVGSTGASTGPHLHFEIRFNGRSVDPLGYLPQE
jgi:murein DD-endopeptidase MepM/ murein hydrolase activator NlpD